MLQEYSFMSTMTGTGVQSISGSKNKTGDLDIELADPTLVPTANSETGTEPSAAAEVTRITSSLLKTNEQLASFLVSSKEDKWKDEEFQSLVSSYLESSSKTLDLCIFLGTCIQRAKHSLLTIWYAVRLFDREMETESEKPFKANKWKILLDDLKGFRTAGGDPFEEWSLKLISLVYEEDQKHIRVLEELKGPTKTSELPFDEYLYQMFVLVYRDQMLLFEKLGSHEGQLCKKLERIRKRKRFSNIIFGIGFFSVPVLTALVMVIPVPSAVEILIGAFSATIGSIGKWCSHSWSKRERDTEAQMKEVGKIKMNTFVMLKDLDILRNHAQRAEIEIEIMMNMAEFVMGTEDGATLGMSEMRLRLESSLLTIAQAASSTSSCTTSITSTKNTLYKKLHAQPQKSVSKARNCLDIFM